MQKIRKAIIVSVMMMTVFSLSVVVTPQVKAATAGDLIKMDGLSSVYYLGADMKRYVFPNEATYFSWYSDFNGIQVVAQSELEQYPLAANVTMRPGTKLVTSPSNSMVYAVEPGGVLRSIVSEENAINLYGADWANRVVDVIDAFFTNYSVGSPLTVGVYPTGSLIKTADSADVYYVEDGKARKFASEASFTGNRLSFDNVLVASELPTTGSDVTGTESAITDTSSGAGGTPNAGTGLTVSVAGDTAPSRNVPSGSTLVPWVTYNLTASSDGDVTVNSLTLTRGGTGNDADFDGGYLYVGNERLSNKRSVSSNLVTFTALNLTIPAGMTKAVTLKMNGDTGDLAGNHYFKIETASDIATNGATVSGAFPLAGNTMTYSSVDAGAVTITGANSNTSYKIGESNVILGEFTIAETSGAEKVYIHRIRLKQNGTAGNDAVKNLSLDLDDNIVVEGVMMADKYVDFVLDTPFELGKSKSITAYVRGDISEDITKTVELYLKNTADVDITGNAYGDFYGIGITNALTAGALANIVTIAGSEINVSFDGPATAETKDDVDDLVLAKFKIKSENQDVSLETLRVVLATGGAANNKPLQNLEMVDSANNASYSVSDPASSTSADLDFENIYIQKGVQYNFEIRGDVQDDAVAGATYSVSINFTDAAQTIKYQDADETTVSSGDFSASTLSGKTMTVAAPGVSFAKVTTNNTSVVKSTQGVMLFKGKVTANSVDDLKVTRVKLDAFDPSNNDQTLSRDYNRLYFYKVNADGTETKLDDETSLGSNEVSFSGFTLNVPKGASNGIYVVVRGDVKTSPVGTTTDLAWNATKSSYNVKDSDNNAIADASITLASGNANAGHQTTVVTVGTYTLAIDNDISGLNNNKNLLAGEMSLVGRLKVTASKEAAILEDLVLQNTGSSTNATLGRLYLYDNAELSGTYLAYVDMSASGYAIFEDINIEVPTTGSTYIYIGGWVKGIDYSGDPASDATASAGATVDLKPVTSVSTYATKALGKETGDTLSNSSVDTTTSTNTFTVMGAVITALTTDFAGATLTAGTAKDLFSFKVTVPESNNIDYESSPLAVKLATTTFNIATTSGVLVDNLMIERVNGANGEKTAIATGPTNTSFTIGFQNTYGTDSDLRIKPGETAEYIVRGDVSLTGTSQSLQVTIESAFDGNLPYFHNTTDATTYTSEVYPLISGTTKVRGGTLSN